MDRERFAKLINPMALAFNKRLDGETISVWYKELGGFTETKLQSAFNRHIATGRHWPKIVEIKENLGIDITKKTTDRNARIKTEHSRHFDLGMRILDAKINRREFEYEDKTLIPMDRVIDKAMRAFEQYEPPIAGTEERRARKKHDVAIGELSIALLEELRGAI